MEKIKVVHEVIYHTSSSGTL